MSQPPNDTVPEVNGNVAMSAAEISPEQKISNASLSHRPQKAPFQQVLDEMRQEPMDSDSRIIIENYAKLMRCYEDDLASVYEAAEEACCRIIAGTELADLLPTLDESVDENKSANMAKRAFYEAINDIQRNPLQKPNRGNLPRDAVARFKAWFEANEEHPCT